MTTDTMRESTYPLLSPVFHFNKTCRIMQEQMAHTTFGTFVISQQYQIGFAVYHVSLFSLHSQSKSFSSGSLRKSKQPLCLRHQFVLHTKTDSNPSIQRPAGNWKSQNCVAHFSPKGIQQRFKINLSLNHEYIDPLIILHQLDKNLKHWESSIHTVSIHNISYIYTLCIQNNFSKKEI